MLKSIKHEINTFLPLRYSAFFFKCLGFDTKYNGVSIDSVHSPVSK